MSKKKFKLAHSYLNSNLPKKLFSDDISSQKFRNITNFCLIDMYQSTTVKIYCLFPERNASVMTQTLNIWKGLYSKKIIHKKLQRKQRIIAVFELVHSFYSFWLQMFNLILAEAWQGCQNSKREMFSGYLGLWVVNYGSHRSNLTEPKM